MHALQAQLSMAQAGRTSPPFGDGGMCKWQIKSVGGQWCNLLDEQNAALSRGMAEGQRVVNLQVTRCTCTRVHCPFFNGARISRAYSRMHAPEVCAARVALAFPGEEGRKDDPDVLAF
jgi:hypothetical protein